MANAFEMAEDRHPRFGFDPADKALAASGNDDVNVAVQPTQHFANGFPVRGRNELDDVFGKTGGFETFRQGGADGARGVIAVRTAPQDGG